ncbi:MAG: DUF1521 domain-containing protein [Leptolinea sp.]|jgi:hypothetical protein|nr:DUF1521 domain-containing protein [Leptolinea sp.]
MYVGSDSLQSLVMARRLLLLTREIEKHRKDPTAETKSFKEIMEEDEITLSGGTESTPVAPTPGQATAGPDNLDIKLSDLCKRLDEVRDQIPAEAPSQESVTITQSTSTSLEVDWLGYKPVDGLAVRDRHFAETNLYTFDFIDGSTFKITDKSTGKSTTIWGDPHVDTSDQDGSNNGDFSDLTSSETHTTFSLRDGTKVIFTARDNDVIESVDIIKGDQMVHGTGSADPTFSEQSGLFDIRLRETSSIPQLSQGDVVYAGGDGNDWFDAAHHMVWGMTTGPLAGSTPRSVLQIHYSEQVRQTLSADHINTSI